MKSSQKKLPISASWLDAGLSFISPGYAIAIHHHHCFQIAISLTDTFDAVINNIAVRNTAGIVVNQQVPHSCQTLGKEVLLHFVTPNSAWGRHLNNQLNGRPFANLTDLYLGVDFRAMVPVNHATATITEIKKHLAASISRIFPQGERYRIPGDERVSKMLDFINQRIEQRISLTEIAGHLFLSPERARHLFKEYTNMPLSQYLLWQRIRAITSAAANGKTLQAASIDCGFLDYAHFSKIFRRMFGVAPGNVLHHCRILL